MAQSDVTATTHRNRKPPKKLSHIEIHQAENGGHTVRHIFTHFEHPSEQHVFGDGQGHAMLSHVAEHMGIDTKGFGAGEEEPQEEKEAAEI